MAVTSSSIGEIRAFVDDHLDKLISVAISRRFVTNSSFNIEYFA